ncbi:Uncharacterised protein [Vibrio cholerae]|nr:Uncharacterised protein [Vibrio cholerae]
MPFGMIPIVLTGLNHTSKTGSNLSRLRRR